jgi:hypothetical protein
MNNRAIDNIISQLPYALHPSRVYVIQDGNAYKIGVSQDPGKRLNVAQVNNPRPLRLSHVLPGGYDVEAALHAWLSERRIRGEWFLLSKGHLDVIGALKARLANWLIRQAEATPPPARLLALYRAIRAEGGRTLLMADLVMRMGFSAAKAARLRWDDIDSAHGLMAGQKIPSDIALRLETSARRGTHVLHRLRNYDWNGPAMSGHTVSNALAQAQLQHGISPSQVASTRKLRGCLASLRFDDESRHNVLLSEVRSRSTAISAPCEAPRK